MSFRSSIGWVAVAAALCWFSIYERPARDSAVADLPVPAPVVAAPMVARQQQAQQTPSPRPAAATQAPAPARQPEPTQPASSADEPSVTAEEARARVEHDVFNAARELAVTKAKLRMETAPLDQARTDELQRQYRTRFDEQRFGVRPEIRCVSSMCKVRVETADAVALAQVDQIHSDLGVQPLTTVDGDPEQGVIRSVSYYVIGDEVMKELVGADTRGILAPGP